MPPHSVAVVCQIWEICNWGWDTGSETVTRDVRIQKRFFEKIVDYFLSQEFCWAKKENREVFIEKFMFTQIFV